MMWKKMVGNVYKVMLQSNVCLFARLRLANDFPYVWTYNPGGLIVMTEEVVLETSVCHLKRFGDQKIFIFPTKSDSFPRVSGGWLWSKATSREVSSAWTMISAPMESLDRKNSLLRQFFAACQAGESEGLGEKTAHRWIEDTENVCQFSKCLRWGAKPWFRRAVNWATMGGDRGGGVLQVEGDVFCFPPIWSACFVFAGKRSRGRSVLIYLTLILLPELQCSSQTNSVMKEFVLAIWPGRRRRRSRSLTILKGLLHDFMNNISRTILGFVFCAFAWTISWSSKRKHHQLVTVFVSRQVANPTNIKGTFSDVFSFVHVCVLYSSLHLFLYHSLIFSLISRRLQQLEQSAT